MRRDAAVLLPAVAFMVAPIGAQEPASYQVRAAEAPAVVSVVPGPHYAAGGVHQALFGRRYRDLWATPIQVPLLDLARFAGGLTPEERGGGMQTTSLKLESGEIDDDEYVREEARLMAALRDVRYWREQYGMGLSGGPVRVADTANDEPEAAPDDARQPQVMSGDAKVDIQLDWGDQ